MRAHLVLLALTLPLAGCMDTNSAPVEPAGTAPNATFAAPAPEPEAPAASPAAPPREEALAYEGRTGRWACVPDSVASCRGVGLGADGKNELYVIPQGDVRALDVEVAWTAATPLTSKLRVALVVLSSCGEGCVEWETLDAVTLPSPVRIAYGEVTLEAGEALGLLVDVPRLGAPLHAYLSVEQDFTVQGTLTLG